MPQAFLDYRRQRTAHWNEVAHLTERRPGMGGYYHRRLVQIYRQTIAPGQRVLEIGCGRGDLLAALQPSFGVGVDFSHDMLLAARQRHPDLHFMEADAHFVPIDATFDVIVLADL